jgi:hypothetical protein
MATARAAPTAAPAAVPPPGPSRGVLRGVLIAGPLLILVGVLVVLSVGDKPLLGTNRVGPAGFFAVVPAGGTLCTGGAERVPAGTGEVVVRTSTSQAGPLAASVRRGGRVIAHGTRTAAYDSGDTAIPLASPVSRSARAVVCVRNGGAKPLGLAGTPAGTSPKVRIDGRPADALIRIEYRAAERVSWWSRIGDVARRFADGKASWVGSATLWLALGLSLVAIVLGLVALWRGPRRAALVCTLVAVLNALAWSLLVPPFQVPDEESHTGYVQYLAETGKVPKPAFIGYSDEENALLRALEFGSVIGVRDNRPPHGPGIDARLRAIERSHPSRVGGGDPAGAVVYPPTFYALESVPYLASPTGSSLLDRLVWMRALCALLAGLTVFLTYRFLRELLPTQPWAWTVGALALAFLPMFGFISGGVQNDAGMYACAAALFWAMTRVLQRGLTPLRGLAIGLAMVTGVLIKYTMVGLAPAAAAAVLVGLWRVRTAGAAAPAEGSPAERSAASPTDAPPTASPPNASRPATSPAAPPARRAWLGAAIAALVVALPIAAYAALAKWAWDRPLTGPLRASHPEIAHPEPATITGQVTYAWELFLPRLPFMDDKFPAITPLWDTWYRGAIGRFGWLDYGFPAWVAILLLPVVLAVIVLAIRAAWQARPPLVNVAIYAVAVLGLMALLAGVGYHYELKFATYFQSPRYLFALLPLGAAIVAMAARGAGRRFGPAVGASLVVLVVALSVFAQLATLERYYGS